MTTHGTWLHTHFPTQHLTGTGLFKPNRVGIWTTHIPTTRIRELDTGTGPEEPRRSFRRCGWKTSSSRRDGMTCPLSLPRFAWFRRDSGTRPGTEQARAIGETTFAGAAPRRSEQAKGGAARAVAFAATGDVKAPLARLVLSNPRYVRQFRNLGPLWALYERTF